MKSSFLFFPTTLLLEEGGTTISSEMVIEDIKARVKQLGQQSNGICPHEGCGVNAGFEQDFVDHLFSHLKEKGQKTVRKGVQFGIPCPAGCDKNLTYSTAEFRGHLQLEHTQQTDVEACEKVFLDYKYWLVELNYCDANNT